MPSVGRPRPCRPRPYSRRLGSGGDVWPAWQPRAPCRSSPSTVERRRHADRTGSDAMGMSRRFPQEHREQGAHPTLPYPHGPMRQHGQTRGGCSPSCAGQRNRHACRGPGCLGWIASREKRPDRARLTLPRPAETPQGLTEHPFPGVSVGRAWSLPHHGLCNRAFSTEEVMARPETPKLYAAT